MNFSQVVDEDDRLVELKYCERCGGLWLRPLESDESYCEGCRSAMAAWPRIGKKNAYHKVHKDPRRKAIHGEGYDDSLVIETLLGVVEATDQNSKGVSAVAEVAL